MNDLRCYVCGDPVLARFRLVSMSKDVDRVFIVSEECFPAVDNNGIAVLVDRATTGVWAVVDALLSYRRRNTRNFQLEKLDDYLKKLAALRPV